MRQPGVIICALTSPFMFAPKLASGKSASSADSVAISFSATPSRAAKSARARAVASSLVSAISMPYAPSADQVSPRRLRFAACSSDQQNLFCGRACHFVKNFQARYERRAASAPSCLSQIATEMLEQRRRDDGGRLSAQSAAAKRDELPTGRAALLEFFVRPTALRPDECC